MATTSIFNAGGLASGLDTNAIIDALVGAQKRPMDVLKSRQSAYTTQISSLGDLVSKVTALNTAVAALGTGGVMASSVASTPTTFNVGTISGDAAGTFTVGVEALAEAAKARSASFGSTATVLGGTLTLGVKGTSYDITIEDGATLSDVATSINGSGAAVKAAVLFDGTNSYLSLTASNTGFNPDDPLGAASALTITENYTGVTGQALGLASTNTAKNALVNVDGLPFVRQSNSFSDVLPGVPLTLTKATPGQTEQLVIAADQTKTTANLQKMVDAYNALAKTLQSHLGVDSTTDRSTKLTGVSSVRALQNRLHAALQSPVSGVGMFDSMASLGLKTNRDGTLTIDSAALSRTIAKDPAAVDKLFSTAGTGMAAVFKTLADDYAGTSGSLVQSQTALKTSVATITTQTDKMQARLDAYRATLLAQYTAMEKTVASLKNVSSFLTNQSNANSNNK